jgi:hypothetical protein
MLNSSGPNSCPEILNKNPHKTLIRPTVMYGAETWAMTMEETNAFRIFERKIVMKICQSKL